MHRRPAPLARGRGPPRTSSARCAAAPPLVTPRPLAKTRPPKTCARADAAQICLCESSPAEAVRLSACAHEFCVDCFSQYVQSRVSDGQVLGTQLVCPAVHPHRCGISIVPQDVRRCLDTSAMARYERLTLKLLAESEEDLGTCPNASCPFIFALPDKGHVQHFDCPLCKKCALHSHGPSCAPSPHLRWLARRSFCLNCRCDWHDGLDCEEYKAILGDTQAGDEAFSLYAHKQQLRQCPKCKFFVEKVSGCDAMHWCEPHPNPNPSSNLSTALTRFQRSRSPCSRCNLVFCFKCGGVLRSTALSSRIKACTCGEDREFELR